MNNKKNYIGPLIIKEVLMVDTKTNSGKDIVKIVYGNGNTELMPKISFEYLVSDKPLKGEWTELRERRINPIVKKTLEIIAEHDFKAVDIEFFKTKIESELLNAFGRATNYLWTKNDDAFIPGIDALVDRSILEADIIIREIDKK